MGKLEHEAVIQHFSHEHPLQLINLNQSSVDAEFAACAGCNLKLSGWLYGCQACDYRIDITCSQLPRQINHRAHPAHTLSLHTSPVYPEGSFDCDACGQKGTGFCFHCEACELDLHVTCAAKPILVKHGGHNHPLVLTISSPYGKEGFMCDVCSRPGTNQLWLYRCDDCGFDAHLCCANSDSMAGSTSRAQQQEWPRHRGHHHMQHSNPYVPGVAARSPSPGGPRSHACHHGMAHPGLEIPLNPLQLALAGTRMGNGLMGNMAQGFLGGMAQQAGQGAIQAILGGGSSGLGVGSAIVGAVLGLN